MISAASGKNPETHAKTARDWQSDIVDHNLAVAPFCLHLKDITPKAVEAEVANIRGQNANDLNTKPLDNESAFGAHVSYLKGTADYEREKREQAVRSSKDFKALGVRDFRKKVAQELRDRALRNEQINFLNQAFRYRGKANYRDSIYLSYGSDNTDDIVQLTRDLNCVARKFTTMACHYVSRRCEQGSWQFFVHDMSRNARFTPVVSLSAI